MMALTPAAVLAYAEPAAAKSAARVWQPGILTAPRRQIQSAFFRALRPMVSCADSPSGEPVSREAGPARSVQDAALLSGRRRTAKHQPAHGRLL